MVVRYVTQSSCENGCFFEPITCILHILLWFYIYILHFIRCCWQNWKYKAWYNMFACLHVYICIYMVKKQTKISYLLGLKFTNRTSSRFFFFLNIHERLPALYTDCPLTPLDVGCII